jgi:uncharacterized protein DUF3859
VGYSISWIALKSASEAPLLSALELALTDEIEEVPESPACFRRLPDGWQLVFSNEMELLTDNQLRELSRTGDVVMGAVEEHTMFSQSEYWVHGMRVFKAHHDSSRGIRHIDIEGSLPPQLAGVPEELEAEQDHEQAGAGDVDFIFDIPVELSAQLTGYRYTDSGDDDEWIVLQPAGGPAKSAGAASRGAGCATLLPTLICVLVVAACFARCKPADKANNMTVELLEFGAFELGPGKPGSREVRFTSHDHVIVPRLGSGFGFRFRLNHVPDAKSIDLSTVVTHPPFRDRDGETSTHYALVTTVPINNGSAASVTGYSFDRPEEMTPGRWTFEHSFRGQTLMKEWFTVQTVHSSQ